MLCAERTCRKGHTHWPSREVAVPGGTRIRCQVLRQVHYSCPHSPKGPHAASQQNARLRKSQNGNTFPADNLDMCHREHPSCNTPVAFLPLFLPFCAPGSAMGHFWAKSCPEVHHRFSKLLEPDLEMRYSTVHSKLYCTPYSPPPPHPHLLPVKTCHIHQGLSVRREKKKICQILNFKWIYPKPLGNSCLRKVSVEPVFQMSTFGCSVPCCCFGLCSCHTWTCPHLE